MLRQLFRGFVRLHILHHAAERPVYGAWLIEELRKHGYAMSPGTLYPILHRMETDGYLQSTYQVVEGRQRRYYQITTAGQRALEQAREHLRELAAEVLTTTPAQASTENPTVTHKGPGETGANDLRIDMSSHET